MLLDDYYWHYDYARLAWDTGFCFDKYKYPNLDKNKICLIDIDRIIKERDVASVERNVSTVVQYVLDNDQAEVLDSNFVKLFRLSQLSVEYLLFCKKYLDKTVVLLKKDIIKLKQEIKDQKMYTEELETQISSLRNKTTTYSCDICSKMFSTEDYLNSHVKRRHNTLEIKDFAATTNSEAEKLHSEIKELKERLNNTEKFIQPSNRDIDNFKEVSEETEGKTAKLVSEIQDSFEKFRKQVEEKMVSLQSEKNFFTEKYDKLFEIVLQYKNREQEQVYKTMVPAATNIENTSTQTEEPRKEKVLEIHTVQHDNTYNFKVKDEETAINKGIKDIDEKIERKLSNFEETIESRISLGLCNLENQIEAFWQKLSKDLPNQPEIVKIIDQPVQTDIPDEISISYKEKPKIKPRTKITLPTNQIDCDSPAESIQSELSKIIAESKPVHTSATVIKSVPNIFESSSESLTELEGKPTAEDLRQDQSTDPASSTKIKVSDQRPKSSITKVDCKNKVEELNKISSIDEIKKKSTKNEMLGDKMRKRVKEAIDTSLQKMGISPSWVGIPTNTFQTALEIVKHQSVLNKKRLPEYDSIRRSIKKLIDKEQCVKRTQVIDNVASSKSVSKPNKIMIQIRKNELFESKAAAAIEIRNRSLYDTDSESDFNTYLPKNFNKKIPLDTARQKSADSSAIQDQKSRLASVKKAAEHIGALHDELARLDVRESALNQEKKQFDQEKAHSAVVEELQTKFTRKSGVSDSSSEEGQDKREKETKSALKAFSSEGSLVKKKVFFDVEEIDGGHLDEATAISKEDSLSDFEIT